MSVIGDPILLGGRGEGGVSDLLFWNYDTTLWTVGGLSSANGTNYTNAKRLRTGLLSAAIKAVEPASGWQFLVYVYSSTGTYLGIWDGVEIKKELPADWNTDTANLWTLPRGYQFRIVAKNQDEDELETEDAINITFGYYTDANVSEKGTPADAYAMGRALYRSKNRATNDPAGLTFWDHTALTSFTPADMPFNSFTEVSGGKLSGFGDFEFGSSTLYLIWCWGNSHNTAIRNYFVMNRVGRVFLFGRTINSGTSVAWTDWNVGTDTDLKTPGAPADAKVVGDKLTPIVRSLSGVVTPHEWKRGTLRTADGVWVGSSTRCYCSDYRPALRTGDIITANEGYQFSLRWYYADKSYKSSTSGWKTTYDVDAQTAAAGWTEPGWYRIVVAKLDDTEEITPAEAAEAVVVTGYTTAEEVVEMGAAIDRLESEETPIDVFPTNTGNCSIRAAKVHNYTDGTPPETEWFLLQKPGTNEFYWSDRDLTRKVFLFKFGTVYTSVHYNFGIMPNGDIIACVDATYLLGDATGDYSGASDDNNRNARPGNSPYVWLASEKWAIQHQVDFSGSGKFPPCAWIENTGFCAMPDGTAVFGEYTRKIVEHCYVWKIGGDITDAANWQIVKSFETSGSDVSGFKHCHAVMLDHYTGITYLATGDDPSGARIYYSLSQGAEWDLLAGWDGSTGEPDPLNEKYCRLVNIIFTEDGAWWATDSSEVVVGQSGNTYYHSLFFIKRNENTGVLDWDFSTAAAREQMEVANLKYDRSDFDFDSFATYGLCYLPEYNALLILDRSDGTTRQEKMFVRLATIDGADASTGKPIVTIHRIATLKAIKDHHEPPRYVMNIGFRCRYKEFYPHGSLVRVGFGLGTDYTGDNRNKIAAFGNQYGESPDNPQGEGTRWSTLKINNLTLKVIRDGDAYRMQLGTVYI